MIFRRQDTLPNTLTVFDIINLMRGKGEEEERAYKTQLEHICLQPAL